MLTRLVIAAASVALGACAFEPAYQPCTQCESLDHYAARHQPTPQQVAEMERKAMAIQQMYNQARTCYGHTEPTGIAGRYQVVYLCN